MQDLGGEGPWRPPTLEVGCVLRCGNALSRGAAPQLLHPLRRAADQHGRVIRAPRAAGGQGVAWELWRVIDAHLAMATQASESPALRQSQAWRPTD